MNCIHCFFNYISNPLPFICNPALKGNGSGIIWIVLLWKNIDWNHFPFVQWFTDMFQCLLCMKVMLVSDTFECHSVQLLCAALSIRASFRLIWQISCVWCDMAASRFWDMCYTVWDVLHHRLPAIPTLHYSLGGRFRVDVITLSLKSSSYRNNDYINMIIYMVYINLKLNFNTCMII